jgi:DNA polymerase-3 subunit gamma/tau
VGRVALYRKYRSQTFGDLVGQPHVVQTLQNSLASGSLAQAYLFTGPRGTGKTSTARLLAKAVNCERNEGAEPCNECEACRSINEGRAMDVVEIDAASESTVEGVRTSIVEAAEYQPAALRTKVYIIDEVHDLSAKAFDALLKTIEEPPSHVLFILATTEASKVPPTIRSRCLRFEFHRGTVASVAERLRYVAQAEGIEASEAAIVRMARMSEGGYRDALSLLELVSVSTGGKVEEEDVLRQVGAVPDDDVDAILRAAGSGDTGGLVSRLDDLFRRGVDARSVANSVLTRVSELVRAAHGLDVAADSAASAGASATATEIGLERLGALREAAVEALVALRDSSLPREWLEARLAMVSEARPRPAPRVAEARATPVPAPAPSAAVAAEPPAPEPTDDPELDRYRKIWQAAYAQIAAGSKAAAARLESVAVRRLENGVAVLEFTRSIDHDYVQDKPERQAVVRKAWDENGGKDIPLAYAVATPAMTALPEVATATVESRLTGSELAQAAQEVFSTRKDQQQ